MTVAAIPINRLSGMMKYSPVGPYSSLASDHVTALLFKLWTTWPLHTLVPVGLRMASRCEFVTDTIVTRMHEVRELSQQT